MGKLKSIMRKIALPGWCSVVSLLVTKLHFLIVFSSIADSSAFIKKHLALDECALEEDSLADVHDYSTQSTEIHNNVEHDDFTSCDHEQGAVCCHSDWCERKIVGLKEGKSHTNVRE